MMQRDGHSTYLKITDTDTGDIVAGSKWCIYDEEPRRDPTIKVDWFGEEGSEDRAYGQWIMEEFHRRRLERMKGSHCRRFFLVVLALSLRGPNGHGLNGI